MADPCKTCNGEGIVTTKQPFCKTCQNSGKVCGAPDCGKGCRCPDCYCDECTFAPCQCGDIHTVCAECNGMGEWHSKIPNAWISPTTSFIVLLVPNFLLFF